MGYGIPTPDEEGAVAGPASNVVVTNFPATVEVSNDVGNPLPVNGTITLDAATLAALEIIGLDAATLAALETTSIQNFPSDYPDVAVLAKVEAVRALLAGTITVAGTVTLDASTLAALEVIGLDAATLAALESISVQNFPSDYPNAAVLAKVEAVRALLAGTLTVTGTVGVSGSVEVTNDVGNPLPVSGTVAVSNPTTNPETGLAKETTLAARLSEATFVAEDFATQTTLATRASEATLVQVRDRADFPIPAAQITALAPLALQPVSATDLDVRDLALVQDSVRQTQRVMSSYVATLASPQTDTVAATITSPDRIRVLRLDGGSKPNNTADTFVTVTIKVGTTSIFVKTLQVGEPIGGQVCLEGAAGDDMTITMTGTGSVEFNLRYEIFV